MCAQRGLSRRSRSELYSPACAVRRQFSSRPHMGLHFSQGDVCMVCHCNNADGSCLTLQVAEELGDAIRIVKVDVDEEQALASHLQACSALSRHASLACSLLVCQLSYFFCFLKRRHTCEGVLRNQAHVSNLLTYARRYADPRPSDSSVHRHG